MSIEYVAIERTTIPGPNSSVDKDVDITVHYPEGKDELRDLIAQVIERQGLDINSPDLEGGLSNVLEVVEIGADIDPMEFVGEIKEEVTQEVSTYEKILNDCRIVVNTIEGSLCMMNSEDEVINKIDGSEFEKINAKYLLHNVANQTLNDTILAKGYTLKDLDLNVLVNDLYPEKPAEVKPAKPVALKRLDQDHINYVFLCMMNAIELNRHGQPIEIVNNTYDSILNQLSHEFILNPYAYTIDELLHMGFRKYDRESNLYLIPIYLFHIIPDYTEIENIAGEMYLQREIQEIGDVTYGLTQFGIRK